MSSGRWEGPFDWGEDIVVHISHLPTGKFLVWGRGKDLPHLMTHDARLWDPNTGQFEDVPYNGTNMFCAGHTHDPDGNLIVIGSHFHKLTGQAQPHAVMFDAFEEEWVTLPNMNYGRWYPTALLLASGLMTAFSGLLDDTSGEYATIPELFDGEEWLAKTSADTGQQNTIWLYPQMFVLPHDNLAFYAGGSNLTRTLDLEEWEWSSITYAPTNRWSGSAVMFDPGRIIRSGGSTSGEKGDGTDTMEYVDLTGTGSYQWYTGSLPTMNNECRHLNLVILPDGSICRTGGCKYMNDPSDAPDDNPDPVYTAEILNPFGTIENWQWVEYEDVMEVPRWYHSVAILMLDGRVVAAGGNWNDDWADPPFNYPDTRSAEIFSPPYLDDGFGNKRPGVNNVPSSIGYGSTFTIQAIPVSGTSIYKASLVKLGSVTHGFDAGQRFMWLNMTPNQYVAGEWHVDEPPNANYAPPGYYMLFVLAQVTHNSVTRLVPSIGKYVKVEP